VCAKDEIVSMARVPVAVVPCRSLFFLLMIQILEIFIMEALRSTVVWGKGELWFLSFDWAFSYYIVR